MARQPSNLLQHESDDHPLPDRKELRGDRILEKLPDEAIKRLRRLEEPSWINPMLATLTEGPFSDDRWYFEIKLDGERCLAFKSGGSVRLMSRNKKELNEEYPELLRALTSQKGDFVVDGEIVAFKNGVSSFARLQNRMHLKDEKEIKERREAIPVSYYLFDILFHNGYETTQLELRYRKQILREAIEYHDRLRYSEHRRGEGEEFFKETCAQGREGLVAKRIDSLYQEKRSEDWLKFKCLQEQEFVIGGYTDPQRSRTILGALLLGYYQDGKLRYAGKVGTGFNRDTLTMLGEKLSKVRSDETPFENYTSTSESIHWAKPRLIAEVKFSAWTKDGRLRHPVYLGLRNDKDVEEVIRERPRKKGGKAY